MEEIKKQQPLSPEQFRVRLLNLVEQGAECIDVAERLITTNKLPFQIVQPTPGKWELRSIFSQGELWLQKFITVDEETIEMKHDAVKMSKTPFEVLVFGETGTGKELIAKSQIGERDGTLRSCNCAGFPRELIESELFGHERGAFTGADRTNEGLIKEAEGGVLFLDEIGEMPMDVQAKLLRVLQDKCVRKVGGKKEEKVDTKFVFATNRNLKEMVKEKLFREDLYARISTLELSIKPLRERKHDIEPIIKSLPGGEAFLNKYATAVETLDTSLNVRSLQQYVIRFNVLGKINL